MLFLKFKKRSSYYIIIRKRLTHGARFSQGRVHNNNIYHEFYILYNLMKEILKYLLDVRICMIPVLLVLLLISSYILQQQRSSQKRYTI